MTDLRDSIKTHEHLWHVDWRVAGEDRETRSESLSGFQGKVMCVITAAMETIKSG